MIIHSLETGPDIGSGGGFCGFFPGVWLAGVLDSFDLGTYDHRLV
jgi:hypothetical protein